MVRRRAVVRKLNDNPANVRKTSPIKAIGKKIGYVLVVIAVTTVSCQKDSDPNPGPPVQPAALGKAKVWLTRGDQTSLLAQQSDISITALKDTPSITIDTTTQIQEMDGFGAALT